MARKYTHIKVVEKEILEMRSVGKTHREIAEEMDLTKKQVDKFITRHNRAERMKDAGVPLRRRGVQAKGNALTDQEKDYEIKRLKMENELLRDFLRHAGRR